MAYTPVGVKTHIALCALRSGFYDQHGPDLSVRNDFENALPPHSPVGIKKVIFLVNRAEGSVPRGGLPLAAIKFILKSGVVTDADEAMNGAARCTHLTRSITWQRAVAWPDENVEAHPEAVRVDSRMADLSEGKVPLDRSGRLLGTSIRRVYEAKVLFNPLLAAVETSAFLVCGDEPWEEKTGLALWAEHDSAHRDAVGAVATERNGNDHRRVTGCISGESFDNCTPAAWFHRQATSFRLRAHGQHVAPSAGRAAASHRARK